MAQVSKRRMAHPPLARVQPRLGTALPFLSSLQLCCCGKYLGPNIKQSWDQGWSISLSEWDIEQEMSYVPVPCSVLFGVIIWNCCPPWAAPGSDVSPSRAANFAVGKHGRATCPGHSGNKVPELWGARSKEVLFPLSQRWVVNTGTRQ